MSHATLRDLTESVHGFAPPPSHALDCDSCAGDVERLEEELDLLRRAEARVAPPATSSRGWRRAPVALAAGLLLALTAWILARPGTSPSIPGQDDPVARFLEGTAEVSERARAEILARGPSALARVVEARRKNPGAVRADALSALAFELKRREAGAPGKDLFGKLEKVRLTFDMQGAPLGAVTEYVSEVTGLGIYIDPRVPRESGLDVKVKDATLGYTLDLLARQTNAEWAFRWGSLHLAPAERLWGPAALPLANRWRAQEPNDASRATARALETLKVDLAFENTAPGDILDFLRDFSKLNVVLEKAGELEPITFKAKDAPLGEALERITLPYGLDARIDAGTIVIYRR